MANRYRRKEVLAALREMVLAVCSDVHTSSRETVKTAIDKFVIIRLQSIDPYAQTHNIAYGQFHLFARDIGNGVENVEKMEEMIDGASALFPFNTEVMSCNDIPLITDSKSDGMGYHSVIMQFKIVIKV